MGILSHSDLGPSDYELKTLLLIQLEPKLTGQKFRYIILLLLGLMVESLTDNSDFQGSNPVQGQKKFD